ncbi:MAG TPA: hypothetical protein VN654_06595 [Vicinamibacterales bacterium]|nr:hypothetical protein [Vicinamibacterales bacterium]
MAPAYAQGSPEDFHLEAGLMFWKPAPDVILTSGTLGTPVDFVNTFAVEKKRLRDYRLVLKPARKHKIRFSSTPIDYDGTATLAQTIRFRGQTYSIGIPTTAELKWTLMRIGYEWDPIASSRGFVGVFGDLKYNKMNAQLSAPLVVTQTFERNVAVPTIGGIARGYLSSNVSATAEFTGIKLDRNNFNAKFYDFDVYGTANFGRTFGLQLGYRSVTVDYDIDSDAGDLKLKGLYFGAAIRF